MYGRHELPRKLSKLFQGLSKLTQTPQSIGVVYRDAHRRGRDRSGDFASRQGHLRRRKGMGEVPHQQTHTEEVYKTPIKWEPVDVTPTLKDGRTVIPDEAIESINANFVALKGPLAVSGLLRAANLCLSCSNVLRRPPLAKAMYLST